MKNKRLRIIVDIILIVVGIIFLIFGIKDAIDMYNSSKVSDALLFKKSYSYVPEDNVYNYVSLKELNKMLKKNSFILLIGEPLDSWTQVLVNPLNEVASSKDQKIYYLETTDLNSSSSDYENLLSNLDLDELTTPYIAFIKDGSIYKTYSKDDLYESDYDGAPIDYWTENRLNTLKNDLSKDIEALE